MADDKVGAPALDTNIESGQFDEKAQQHQQQAPAAQAPKKVAAEGDDEDEDIDALIEDLESQDGHDAFDEEEEEGTPGGGRTVPEEMLQTDSRVGLTESEVVARRRKYGLNQMKEEKENLILKFFSYFIGPIQFVMEVSFVPLVFPFYCLAPIVCSAAVDGFAWPRYMACNHVVVSCLVSPLIPHTHTHTIHLLRETCN
jgi:H+-transporting ATPase